MNTKTHSSIHAHTPTAPRTPTGTRISPRLLLVPLGATLLTAACSGPLASSEPEALEASLGSAQFALTEEEAANFNPVMVTSGTCRSKGFRPIENPAACNLAETELLGDIGLAPGPISSPPFNSAPHGCSVSITSIVAEGSALATVYNEGTPEELDAQSCSHDVPCICQDDVTTTPVCRDGEFQPDPDKYYTLRSPNGRYLRSRTLRSGQIVLTEVEGDASQPYSQPGKSDAIATELPVSDLRLHFRFAAEGGGFSTISRDRGMGLVSEPLQAGDFGGDGAGLRLSREPDAASFSCNGSQVLMDLNGLSPVDAGGLLSDSNRTAAIAYPFAQTEPQSPGFMRRTSNCMKKHRTCGSVFGEGFEQTGRSLCGAFNQLHRLTCEKTLDAPVSMHVPQGWYIEEVEDYSRAVNFDPAPIRVDSLLSPAAVGDSLASFGGTTIDKVGAAAVTIGFNSLEKSGPLYGALFSVGLNAAFELGLGGPLEQPDPVADLADAVREAMEQLAADMEARTEELINSGLAQESARELSDRINERRRWFYDEFPALKVSRLGLGDPDEALRLADDLFVAARELGVDIAASFPPVSSSPSELDLKRAHFGLDVAKLAMVELTIMLAEGILLEAYGLPELSCEQVLIDRALQDKADAFIPTLEGAVGALVDYGAADRAHRDSHNVGEFTFDAVHFSYPIADQREFFQALTEETLEQCLRLRDPEDTFRHHFETNTAVQQ